MENIYRTSAMKIRLLNRKIGKLFEKIKKQIKEQMREDSQLANTHMKKCSTSLVNREIEIKTTM